MMPSIKEQLSKKIEKIEQTIDFYLPEEKGLQKASDDGRGKRSRLWMTFR